MAKPEDYFVAIPFNRFTPFPSAIVTSGFSTLNQTRSVQLLVVMCDRAWHQQTKKKHKVTKPGPVTASLSDLATWTGMDERTAKKCLAELQERHLVRKRREGVLRSRIRKPSWIVPAAGIITDDWFPVPRFIIRKYCRIYPNAVVLLPLLRAQHIGWQDTSWIGVFKLSKQLGWSHTRVRKAIRDLALNWEKLDTGLPTPLKITYGWYQGKEKRYFHVMAVHYQRRKRTPSSVVVSRKFAKHFRVSSEIGYESE